MHKERTYKPSSSLKWLCRPTIDLYFQLKLCSSHLYLAAHVDISDLATVFIIRTCGLFCIDNSIKNLRKTRHPTHSEMEQLKFLLTLNLLFTLRLAMSGGELQFKIFWWKSKYFYLRVGRKFQIISTIKPNFCCMILGYG